MLYLIVFRKQFSNHKVVHTQLQNHASFVRACLIFVTAFFQTKVYLFALASNFVPSIKNSFDLKFHQDHKEYLTFQQEYAWEQGRENGCFENRANVA
mgnify:CR=1 FL=1